MKHHSEAELLERISGLEKRIQELEFLVNVGPDLFFLKDLQLRYQLSNRANATFFGRNQADILGRTDKELMAEEAALACEECDRQAIREKQMVVRIEAVGDRFCETRRFPVIEKGEIVGVAGIIHDITDRRRTELALRTSQLQLSEAMDLANIVYWEFDSTDNTYTFNDPFYALYGTTAEQEGGYRMAREEYAKRFIHPDDQQLVYQFVKQNTASPGLQSVADLEHRIVRRDGEIRYILVRTRIVKDDSGRVVKRYGANQDITRRKQAEEEKARLEEQLRQGQKMEALGTFAGGIAHDFNNILAAIIGFCELARDKVSETSPARRHLDRVFTAGLRGRDLVRQILTFSRQAGLEKKVLQLGPIVKETVRLLRASIPTTIDIRVKANNGSHFVLADSTQIQQVIMNLCANAAQAMGKSGGAIAIDLGTVGFSSPGEAPDPVLLPGRYVKLSVADTGEGMTSDVAGRIFDPFFTTKSFPEGTGLGLSVAHGIVGNHGGAITVRTEPGRGSIFTVYLPEYVGEKNITSPGRDPDVHHGHERLLFIEDEEPLSQMGGEMLTRLGYTVTCKTSSREALALIRQDPYRFDIVLTDQTMPEMTGLTLATELRTIRPDLPIILCTGFSNEVDAETAKQAGLSAFVMKPLTRAELAKTVREVLDARPASPHKR